MSAKERSGALWLVLMLCAGVAAGCGGSDDAQDDATAATVRAKAEFWDAVHRGHVDAIPAAREHLIAALSAQPNDDETARLIGRSYGLVFAESQSGPNPIPVSEFRTYLESEGSYLQYAVAVSTDPYAKALNEANYSGVPYALGKLLGDDAMVASALALMDKVKEEYPALGLFALGPKLMRQPKNSKDFALALEDMFKGYEICSATTIDRERPDMTRALRAPFTSEVCGNLPSTPHNIQGTGLIFADMLVKNGQIDAARPVYELIKSTDGYDTWAFRKVVDDRLGSDLAARASRYGSTNPYTEPPLGASPCLGCHQG